MLGLAAALIVCLSALAWTNDDTPASSNSLTTSSSRPMPAKLAPFKERLAAAKSVKVRTAILGVELDSTLESAHRKLDSLGVDAAKTATSGEGEHTVSWQLGKTDYGSLFVKADEKERITYVAAFVRPGKEIPFDEIGQLEKAPVLTDRVVAWDVLRPDRPLVRVVARGADRKATSVTMFIVKRPRTD